MLLGFWLGRFQLSGRGVTTTGSMFWRKKGNGSYVVCWRNKRVTQSKWFHGILTKLVGIGERGCQTHIFPSDTTHYNLKKIFSQTSRSHFNHRSRVLSAIFFILMLFALKEDCVEKMNSVVGQFFFSSDNWPSLKVSGYEGFRLASGQLSPCAIATVQREIGKTRIF